MKYLRNDPELKERRRGLRRNQTESERLFWQQVRGKQFHGLKFFRQYSVGSYILDFYCPTLRLAVELDGSQHNRESHKEYDAARSAYLEDQGIVVLRFWNHDVLKNLAGVLDRLEQQAQTGSSTSNPSRPPL